MHDIYSALMGRMNASPQVLSVRSRKQPIKCAVMDGGGWKRLLLRCRKDDTCILAGFKEAERRLSHAFLKIFLTFRRTKIFRAVKCKKTKGFVVEGSAETQKLPF